MVAGLNTAGSLGAGAEPGQSNDEQIKELKIVLPSEIVRLTNQIEKLAKELEQLEECKKDISENLFEGFEDGGGVGAGAGEGGGNFTTDVA